MNKESIHPTSVFDHSSPYRGGENGPAVLPSSGGGVRGGGINNVYTYIYSLRALLLTL